MQKKKLLKAKDLDEISGGVNNPSQVLTGYGKGLQKPQK
jgi:hypothetical protein